MALQLPARPTVLVLRRAAAAAAASGASGRHTGTGTGTGAGGARTVATTRAGARSRHGRPTTDEDATRSPQPLAVRRRPGRVEQRAGGQRAAGSRQGKARPRAALDAGAAGSSPPPLSPATTPSPSWIGDLAWLKALPNLMQLNTLGLLPGALQGRSGPSLLREVRRGWEDNVLRELVGRLRKAGLYADCAPDITANWAVAFHVLRAVGRLDTAADLARLQQGDHDGQRGSGPGCGFSRATVESARRLLHYCPVASATYCTSGDSFQRLCAAEGGLAVTVEQAHTRAGPMQPVHYVAVDHPNQCVLVSIRGSHSVHDFVTNLDFEVTAFAGSHAHSGFVRAARWVGEQVEDTVVRLARGHPSYRLVVVGHSLGAGAASCLALEWRRRGVLPHAEVVVFAPPAGLFPELAEACAPFTTAVALGDDIVPRLTARSALLLTHQLDEVGRIVTGSLAEERRCLNDYIARHLQLQSTAAKADLLGAFRRLTARGIAGRGSADRRDAARSGEAGAATTEARQALRELDSLFQQPFREYLDRAIERCRPVLSEEGGAEFLCGVEAKGRGIAIPTMLPPRGTHHLLRLGSQPATGAGAGAATMLVNRPLRDWGRIKVSERCLPDHLIGPYLAALERC